jgi:hypothetical protein
MSGLENLTWNFAGGGVQPTMRTSLSRHFYRLDEVRTALRDCIIERRVEKGLFWTQELLDSGEDEYLFEILLEAWAFAIGPTKLRWIVDAYDVGQVDLLMLSLQLLRLPRESADCSLLGVVLRGYEDCRRLPAGFQLSVPADAFRVAVRAGNVRGAVAAWLQIESGVASVVLGEMCALAPRDRRPTLEALATWDTWVPDALTRPIWATLTQTMAILCLCMTDAQWVASISPYKPITTEFGAHVTGLLEEWRGLLGRRGRRVYEIPRDVLKWETARGRMRWSESTWSDVWRVWEHLQGTRCWDDLADSAGYGWQGYDSAGWEDFVEGICYKDDWPEEWSTEDQAKSHGDGCLSPKEVLYRPQWLRRWLPQTGICCEGLVGREIVAKVEELEAGLEGSSEAVYMWEFLEHLPVLETMGWSTDYKAPECPAMTALTSGVKTMKLSELKKRKQATLV